MKYLVTQEWHYTVEVEVEAENENEAKEKADGMEGQRSFNDFLYDSTATEITE